MELLLSHGAHIDICNASGQKPSEMLKEIPDCKINPLQYQTLRCLAASVISKHGLHFRSEVPSILEDFIEAH